MKRTLLALMVLALPLLAACGGGASEPAAAAPAPTSAEPAATQYDFATGPAVLIAAGYESPSDRVDSTGAYLPVNGRPTVVFVDAIW